MTAKRTAIIKNSVRIPVKSRIKTPKTKMPGTWRALKKSF
jgi:hypothetical protein